MLSCIYFSQWLRMFLAFSAWIVKQNKTNSRLSSNYPGETVTKRIKFWLLLLLGISIFTPFFLLSIMLQITMGAISFHGILLSFSFLLSLFIYCYHLYRFVYRGAKPKYPIVPPEGRTDIYLPRTDIPRPIHEDLRRYPEFFKKKKLKRMKKKAKRREKMKRKK